MLRPIDNFFSKQKEPLKTCLLFLRAHILKHDDQLTESWKYGMPFYCYNKKMICYLWVQKKYDQPYLGIVEGKKINHPELIQEKRVRMKIFLINPELDIPIRKINLILRELIATYKLKERK
jgi:hypothetical protein